MHCQLCYSARKGEILSTARNGSSPKLPYLWFAGASVLFGCAPQSPRPQELLGALAAGQASTTDALILRDESTPSGCESLLLGATIGPLYVDADAATVTAQIAEERWNAVPPEVRAAWMQRIDLLPGAAQGFVLLRFHFQLEDQIWKLDLRRPTLASSESRRTGA